MECGISDLECWIWNMECRNPRFELPNSNFDIRTQCDRVESFKNNEMAYCELRSQCGKDECPYDEDLIRIVRECVEESDDLSAVQAAVAARCREELGIHKCGDYVDLVYWEKAGPWARLGRDAKAKWNKALGSLLFRE